LWIGVDQQDAGALADQGIAKWTAKVVLPEPPFWFSADRIMRSGYEALRLNGIPPSG
jgi:hypothetical protein